MSSTRFLWMYQRRFLLLVVASVVVYILLYLVEHNSPFFGGSKSTRAVTDLTIHNVKFKYIRSLYERGVNTRIAMANKVYPNVFPPRRQVRTMFASSLWIEKDRVYLSVVRMYTQFYHSVLYLTTHDKNWKERRDSKYKVGQFIAPCVLNIDFETEFDLDPQIAIRNNRTEAGPEDPRMFVDENGHISIAFNMKIKNMRRRMHILDLNTGKLSKLVFEATNRDTSVLIGMSPFEKNWGPLVIGRKLYFVHNLRHLQLLHCDSERKSSCYFVKKANNLHQLSPLPDADTMKDVSRYRIGPPLVEIVPEFYVTFGFIHLRFLGVRLVYRPCLIVVHVPDGDASQARSIYFSEVFNLWPSNKTHETYQPKIVMVTSIASIDRERDLSTVIVLFNDELSAVFEMRGMLRLVESVADKYKKNELDVAVEPEAMLKVSLNTLFDVDFYGAKGFL